MMKEIAKTLRDELKRIVAEGNEFIALDDDSVGKLKYLASEIAPKQAKQEQSVKKITIQKREEIRDSELDALTNETFSEIKFETKIDMEKLKPQTEDAGTRKLKISRSTSPSSSLNIAPIPPAKPFQLPEGNKRTKWEFLRDKVLSDEVCNAHIKPEKKVVFGVGNLDAKIFFCGEAPGADEEIQGEPFVGRAGQLLTKIITAMGLKREDVYIGNIMNWRPEVEKGNRPPTQEEMQYCLPYLKAQIDIVSPEIVVALGMTAVKGLLGDDPSLKMFKLRGKWNKLDGRDLMITYHPSYLLQYGSAATKRLVWEDMMMVMERAGIPISEKQRGYFLEK